MQSSGHDLQNEFLGGVIAFVFGVALWAWKAISKDLHSTRVFVEAEMKKTREHIDTSLRANSHNSMTINLQILRRLFPEKRKQIDDMDTIRQHDERDPPRDWTKKGIH